ncbi:MAG: cytochrome c [Deltaproteobacteria bacterium]|nr:cytochrome c [Deltaproteobacteria bacterium]
MQKKLKKLFKLSCCFAFLLTACGTHEKPTFEYMPNMMDQPSVKAQEKMMRSPVAGTIPLGFEPYPYLLSEGDLAGKMLKNPLPRTRKTMERGKKMFNTYCAVCHGPRGLGDGSIVPKFPRPPMLSSEKVRAWADGQIYHTITMGQNLMPSYASQVEPEDRWAIVHYVRAIQRANHPTKEDVEKLKKKLEEMKR